MRNEGHLGDNHTFLYTVGHRNSMNTEGRLNHNRTFYILLGNEIYLVCFVFLEIPDLKTRVLGIGILHKMKGVSSVAVLFIYFWAQEFYEK